MAPPRLALVTPPVIKPGEPGLSAPAAATVLRSAGVDAFSLDASLGWYRHTLDRARLTARVAELERAAPPRLAAFRSVVTAWESGLPALQRGETYRDRRVYSSAVNHLDNALALASTAWDGVRLRVADVEWSGGRVQDSRVVERFAAQPGPFDAYFTQELIPHLAARDVTHVGISLTFLNQGLAAFRLARLLQDHLPGVTRLLGGPLPACWRAVGTPMQGGPFALFHRVIPGTPEELASLAVELGGSGREHSGPLAPDLQGVSWHHYLSPVPVIPVALGRGCYWRRCTFCPDHLHPRHAGQRATLAKWLRTVADRFPGGAMLHLTDSAVAPADLRVLATVIREEALPLRWHGFVRLERAFADPEFARLLAEGGGTLLQFGMETASDRLLGLLEKGGTAAQSAAVLEATAAAGIRNLVYLLFGVPTETEADREVTLAFLERHAPAIHDVNPALLNLPRGSPMHREPARFGITDVRPFAMDTDLSLYDDFRCGSAHPRLEARRWMGARLFRSPAVRAICGDLKDPFKANHACFLAPGRAGSRP